MQMPACGLETRNLSLSRHLLTKFSPPRLVHSSARIKSRAVQVHHQAMHFSFFSTNGNYERLWVALHFRWLPIDAAQTGKYYGPASFSEQTQTTQPAYQWIFISTFG
jgi:hypothetical protein